MMSFVIILLKNICSPGRTLYSTLCMSGVPRFIHNKLPQFRAELRCTFGPVLFILRPLLRHPGNNFQKIMVLNVKELFPGCQNNDTCIQILVSSVDPTSCCERFCDFHDPRNTVDLDEFKYCSMYVIHTLIIQRFNRYIHSIPKHDIWKVKF